MNIIQLFLGGGRTKGLGSSHYPQSRVDMGCPGPQPAFCRFVQLGGSGKRFARLFEFQPR